MPPLQQIAVASLLKDNKQTIPNHLTYRVAIDGCFKSQCLHIHIEYDKPCITKNKIVRKTNETKLCRNNSKQVISTNASNVEQYYNNKYYHLSTDACITYKGQPNI